jgi:subtilisin family serine protease
MWPPIQDIDDAFRHGTGDGVRVAILDTGIDQTHRDLAVASFGDAIAVREDSGRFRAGRCDPEDLFGHGTAIAGIVHSLAPAAELMSIRVLDCHKLQHRHAVIRTGAMFAIEAGVQILNCSFGLPGVAFSLPTYKSWTDRAFELDRHVVAASSNTDPDECHWPASFPQVIATTAADTRSREIRFRPSSLISFEARGIDVPVLVPGGGSAVMTGSSFAAAHLSGLLARILSCFPGLSPSFAQEALRRLAGCRDPMTHG